MANYNTFEKAGTTDDSVGARVRVLGIANGAVMEVFEVSKIE